MYVTDVTSVMSACETRIPCSEDTRRELRILKAQGDRESYDETLAALIDAYDDKDA
jgi:hypothetical protein